MSQQRTREDGEQEGNKGRNQEVTAEQHKACAGTIFSYLVYTYQDRQLELELIPADIPLLRKGVYARA